MSSDVPTGDHELTISRCYRMQTCPADGFRMLCGVCLSLTHHVLMHFTHVYSETDHVFLQTDLDPTYYRQIWISGDVHWHRLQTQVLGFCSSFSFGVFPSWGG